MLVYSSVLLLVLVVGAPWWLARMATSGRYRAGFAGRLGRVPVALRRVITGKKTVWVHAVSVGEVLAATRLVAELEARLGADWVVVVSTTTAAGQTLARERFGAERVFFYPLDFAWAVRAYLQVLRPKLLVLMESELWPRMLLECGRAKVRVAVVNSRMSDRSFRRAMRVRHVWDRVLQHVTLFLTQSDEDARRLVAVGARADGVKVAGNLKFDVRAPQGSRVAELVREAAAGRPVVVAGSTCDGKPAPEEQIFLQGAMGPVWQDFPNTLLVLAPRQTDRFAEVLSLASKFGPTVLATHLLDHDTESLADKKIIVLDTIGDLAAIYGIADVAFVGGSLVKRGGHNPLEPAQFGVPVVMGPSYENFRDIVGRMQAANGIAIVEDEFACHEVLLNLLGRRPADRVIGSHGQQVFLSEAGATERVVAELMELMR